MEMVTDNMAKVVEPIDREALTQEYQKMLARLVIDLQKRAAYAVGTSPSDVAHLGAMPWHWSILAPAAAGLAERDQMAIDQALAALTELASLQFPIAGVEDLMDFASVAYCARAYLGDFGQIFWRVLKWAYQDDLITMAEAAQMTGTTIANMGQHSRLVFFHDPDAPQRQGSRLVLRSQVVDFYGVRG